MWRSAKILILSKERIIEKFSYECCAYDKKSLLGYVHKNDKIFFMHLSLEVTAEHVTLSL